MKTRIISAIILLIICLPPLLLGGIYLKALAFLIALCGSYEYANISCGDFLTKTLLFLTIFLFVFSSGFFSFDYLTLLIIFILALFIQAVCLKELTLDKLALAVLLALILSLALKAILAIYALPQAVALMFFIAFGAFLQDAFAYFVGRAFGKHQLIARISPHKTIEGALGGWLCAFILSFIYAYFCLKDFSLPFLFILALTLPLAGQLGDLAFSLFKRYFAIKDFSNLIPGHGGVLDRCDSLFFALIYYLCTSALLARIPELLC